MLGVLLVWAMVIPWLAQGGVLAMFLVSQVTGFRFRSLADPLVNLVVALLVAVPALLGLRRSAWPRYRAVYRALVWTALAMALLAGPRFLGQEPSLGESIARVALLVLLAGWLVPRTGPAGRGGLGVAALAGIAVVWPWLHYGALGAPLDVTLAAIEGALLGVIGGALAASLDRALDDGRTGWNVWLAGVTLVVVLSMLAWGTPLPGSRLLLALALPPLGWAGAALARRAGWGAPAVLLGMASAAALAFFDPAEVTLVLMDGDIFAWALRAAAVAAAAGLAVSLVLWIGSRLHPRLPRVLSPAAAVVALLVVAALTASTGRAGFYGDEFFVVLRDQADLSALKTVQPREARGRAVYETLTRHALASQRDLRAFLDRREVAYTPFYLVNAIEVHSSDPLLRTEIAQRPDVDRILESPRLRPLPAPLTPLHGGAGPPAGVTWGIADIGADRVWKEFGVRGAGIIVGQSDSGVDPSHPALRDSYVGRHGSNDYAWFDPWYGRPAPEDPGGHGTHTLGTILGDGGIGVAPDAEWIACANLPRNLGNPADYLACLQFMLAPFPQGGDPFVQGDPARAPHVLNNSWGCPPLEGCEPTTLEAAVAALRTAGIFVVASAGNDGPQCATIDAPPALFDQAFTVGAYAQGGDLAPFSSRGPVTADGSGRTKPDIAAPGVDVLSALPGNGYGYLDGTSMAGPHVAGVVALMWSAQPALIGDIDRTEALLTQTARPAPGPFQPGGCGNPGAHPNDYVGYGLLDAYAAVKAARP
ncbi:MAG: S8 family serine peptidase [Ardenticatenaceae bacterium]|nr:S8 family serine peptidase [Ardenticatenaceae bacterium]